MSTQYFEDVTESELSHIKAICFDIDDTVTTDGKLPAASYSAMWALKEKGYILIPITGRSASWCDHFARFWPVDAVVGENGAFTFYMEDGVRRRLDTAGDEAPALRKRISEFRHDILQEFPDAVWASDQDYREYDIAIDICEDVPTWEEAEVERLLKFCKDSGAKAKLSSIHVNTWFGKYDKSMGIKTWLNAGAPGLSCDIPKWNEMIFIGDSPNDEPLFEAFEQSVGVNNVADFIENLTFRPSWITRRRSGDGFVDFSTKLLQICH